MTPLAVLDLLGVALFAASGALAAGRKRLDLIGVFVLALVTAIGGGTIRDVLLDRHPIFWLADQTYLIVIGASATLTFVLARGRRVPASFLPTADALGLALFSVSGAQIAERAGLPPLAGILLGTVTGSAGGAVRDVLSAEIPLILRRGELYASAAIAGCSAYFLLEYAGVERRNATLVGMAVVAVVRLLAIRRGLALPEFHVETRTDEHRVP